MSKPSIFQNNQKGSCAVYFDWIYHFQKNQNSVTKYSINVLGTISMMANLIIFVTILYETCEARVLFLIAQFFFFTKLDYFGTLKHKPHVYMFVMYSLHPKRQVLINKQLLTWCPT